jgi:hypothetical protein
MTAFIFVLVVGTSIWVGVDASKREWGDDSFANSTGKWVIGSLLLWIVVFPVYLSRRGRATLKGVGHPALTQVSPAAIVPTTPAAGWYIDPNDPSLLRYWSGLGWTTQTTKPTG